MRLLFFLLFIIGSLTVLRAQDKIYMTSGKIIECKVTDAGTEEIKYRVSIEADAVIFSVKKIDVIRIEFADGHVEVFNDDLKDPDLYKDNKKNAWKFDFISPVFGSSILGYERSIRPGLSIEGNLGIIGLGYDEYDIQPRGGSVMFGPKFLSAPDYRSNSSTFYHILKGLYFQPQFIFGVYEGDFKYFSPTETLVAREITTYSNLIMNFGRQIVFNNTHLVDVYAGIGYGISKTSTKYQPADMYKSEFHPYIPYYGTINPDLPFPVAVSVGIKLGFLSH